jgi:hypothetical protein
VKKVRTSKFEGNVGKARSFKRTQGKLEGLPPDSFRIANSELSSLLSDNFTKWSDNMYRAIILSLVFVLVMPMGMVFAEAKSTLTYNVTFDDFDTGLAISNGGTETGTVLFRLFVKQDSEMVPIEVTTAQLASAGRGAGADEQGNVSPGATYTVLASEIAAAAGLSSYSGQIEIEAGFESASAVNFIFNDKAGTAHGYRASANSSGSGGGFAVQTFWGRRSCPESDGYNIEELINGFVYAATVVGSVGGVFCADRIDSVSASEFSEVEIQGVYEKDINSGVGAVPCVVCAVKPAE